MDNPYKAPTTPVKDGPPPPRSPILAVLAGVATDIGGTVVSGIVIAVIYGVTLASRGMRPEEIQAALVEMAPGSGYFVAALAVGLGFSVLGGYVCARIARRRERQLTAIQALLSVAIGFAMGGGGDDGPWVAAATVAGTLAAVMLGGELGRRRNVAQAREAGGATAA